MKFTKVFVSLVLLFKLLRLETDAFISIEIDPDDLDRISEFFHSIIITDQPRSIIPTRGIQIKTMFKKIVCSVVQLIGVMLSLVGASIISNHFAPVVPVPVQEQQPQQDESLIVQNATILSDIIKNIESCGTDYGCNKNLCWKSCYTKDDYGRNLWCRTSSFRYKFQHCNTSSDCLFCWDCIEKCHE